MVVNESEALKRIRGATKRSNFNFWQRDLRDNCDSAYDYAFNLTCVMRIPDKTFQISYVLAANKTVKQ